MPYDSSKYMDKDGNIIHTRSGDMIKRRIETNKFTGEGELVDVDHSKPRKKEKKKKKGNIEIILDGLAGLELGVSWASMIFDSSIEKPITKKNYKTLLTNLETLKVDVDTVIALAKKFRDNNVA